MKELPTSGTVNAVDARELLHDLAGLRQRGRRPAGLWPPLVVFGVVAVAGTPLAAWRSLAGDLWWVAAAPVGFALVGRFAAGQARGRGYQAPGWPLTTLVAVSLAVVGTALALSTAPSWTVQAGVGLAMLAGGLLLRHGPESASRRGEEAPSRSGPEAPWREPEAV